MALLYAPWPGSAQPAPSLRSAASFAVLGGSSVTNSGPTRITGNLGVSPGTALAGISPANVLLGDIFQNDAIAREAQRDNAAAYNELAGRTCSASLLFLGGRTLAPGVYCLPSPAELAGTVTLDAAGNADAVWVFQVPSVLSTAPDASVVLINGGHDRNVFWRAGDSATLGAGTAFIGNILARTGITMNAGASLSGRALAQTGTVTLNDNDVSLCCAPITLTPATLPRGAVGIAYPRTVFTASGGLGPHTFSVIPGTLPDGLSLASDGVLSGTPAREGSFTFTVTATDAQGCSGSAVYAVAIDCAPPGTLVLSPGILRDGIAGNAYTETFTSGGTPPYTCAVTSGMLPPGLSLTGCTLSGTPTTAGSFAFRIAITDSLSLVGSRCYTLVVIPCPIDIVSPDSGTACIPYSDTIEATGGTAPYTFAAPPGALPAGLSLSPGGLLSGIPAAPGTTTFPVTATDALSVSCTRPVTVDIACPVIAIAPLPGGTVGLAYDEMLAASPCPGPYTFVQTGGELPPGLDLTDGRITGTPTKRGTSTITVTATAANGCSSSGEDRIVIDISCPPIVISPAVLPQPTEDVFYDVTITASGGIGPYELRVSEGTLPGGLTLSTAGRLFGTPTETGGPEFTVTAKDTVSECEGSRTYPPFPPPFPVPCPSLEISPSTLPSGTVGTPYSETLAGSGGTAPYTFVVVSGSLPPGLTLFASGVFNGTPASAGTFAFTVRIRDSAGCFTDVPFCSIDIHAATCQPGTVITLSPAALPRAPPGAPYSQMITASGGTPPYTFTVTSGTLPPGLTLGPLTGVISGTPTANGSFDFTITATDANGCLGSQCYTISVTVAIPALSEWAVLMLAALLAGAGLLAMRRAHGG